MKQSTTRQEKQRQRFKVGSQAFFSMYLDFAPSDIDEVEFEEKPRLFRDFMQIRKKDRTRCLFIWRKMDPDEFVEYTLKTRLPMEIGQFLVPEVAEYLCFTLDHLRRLAPVVERLDARHKYEKIIYDSYLQNGGFYLTDQQRAEAYNAYKLARNK